MGEERENENIHARENLIDFDSTGQPVRARKSGNVRAGSVFIANYFGFLPSLCSDVATGKQNDTAYGQTRLSKFPSLYLIVESV